MDPKPDERRDFQRVAGDGLVVGWRVPVRGVFAHRKPPVKAKGLLVDVSVAGASVIVEEGPRARRGDVVTLSHAGAIGTVQVRWVREMGRSKAMYGVEFLVLEPLLREHLSSPVAHRRGRLAVEPYSTAMRATFS